MNKKNIKSYVILLISMMLSACGGGTNVVGNSSTPVSGPTVTNFEDSPFVNFGTTYIPTSTGYLGSGTVMYTVLTTGDLNSDGYDDIVIGLSRAPDKDANIGEIKSMVLIYDPVQQNFKPDPQLQAVLPMNQMPRQAAIVDINSDGRMDLFINDTGYDEAPYGGQNKLILNTPTGYVDRTDLLPQVWDYSHGLIVADFNNDGVKDLFVINNQTVPQSRCADFPSFTDCPVITPKKESSSYIIYGKTLTTSLVSADKPTDLIPPVGQAYRISVGTASDFNKDGVQDIVLASKQGISVLESRSIGSYKTAQVVPISIDNKNECSQGWAYSYVIAGDLDNDGVNEVVGAYTCDTLSWTDQRLQVIKRKNGLWVDVTDQFIPSQRSYIGKEGYWCVAMEIVDINADGRKDIICSSPIGFFGSPSNIFWVQKPNGTFENQEIALKNTQNTTFHAVLKLGNDKYFVGVGRNFTYPVQTMSDYIQVLGWKIPK